MPAPNVYQGAEAPALFTDLPDELKSNQIDLLYVTDRTPETDEDGNLTYGYGRSRSMAFGSAVVSIEPEMTWADLEKISLETDRSTELTLQLDSIREIGRYPETPPSIVLIDGQAQTDPAAIEEERITDQLLHTEIKRRLEFATKPEIVLFVHGFNNPFDQAALVLAEVWHFMGREHIPILYTWPAGRGGASGYIYDRESGEFTIHHLKNLLRSLTKIEEIEKFHLIAHSRGTDVLTTALRELVLEERATHGDIPVSLSSSKLILAAPDMDIGVVEQRLIAEKIYLGMSDATIYTSPQDKAISMAERFFKSVTRLGSVSVDEMSDKDLSSIENIQGISIVEFRGKTDKTGHSYFHTSPAASSDLILTIRYGFSAGSENGRPLTRLAPGFWAMEDDYPSPPESDDQ